MALASVHPGLLARKHLRRTAVLAVACGFVLLMVFGGGFNPPAFPFPYEHIPYCFQLVAFGPCVASIQYNLGLAAVDFVFWLGMLSLGVFGLIGFLTSPADTGGRTVLLRSKRRILGLIIIGVIGFSIFVPILPVPGGTYTFCDYRAGYCRPITIYGSLTYLLLCSGTVGDTAGRYSRQVCLYFSPQREASEV